MAEMPFVSSLVQEDLPVWQQCLDTEFLRRMEDGTLDEACFKGYIVEDSLYLREYALLGFVQESEDVTRLHYLEQFGLSEADLQALPLRPENRAYVDCMINAAKNGEGEAECIMACLPCMLSYGWIFQKMLDRSPAVRDTLYGPLVQDYAGPGYADACRAWAAYAEKVCTGLSPERAARCRAIFHDCSVHELHFWEMSAKPRTDL